MSIIPPRDQEAIRTLFEEGITGEVRITYFTERPSAIFVPGRATCEYCEDTRKLLEAVCALSDKIALEVVEFKDEPERAERYGISRIPAFVLEGAARGAVRYFGIPAGYEFAALIHDVVDVSRGTTTLSDETR